VSRQGRDTQVKPIDPSFMAEGEDEHRGMERERGSPEEEKKESIKRHAPTENEKVSYVPISSHAETKQKG
jgi:hypothetical protein